MMGGPPPEPPPTVHRSPLLRVGVCALASLVVVGCHDDANEPFRPLTVALSVAPTTPYLTSDPSGRALIGCDFSLNAQAQGSDKAVWEDATFHWTIGATRQTPVQAQAVSAAEVRAWWGGDTIPTGYAATTGIQVSADVPFGADLEMNYRNVRTGEVKATHATLSCVPPGATAKGDLAIPRVGVTSTVPQPGDVVQVSFDARAGAGVWQTMVVASGAVDTVRRLFPENAQHEVTRTVAITVPASARLGQPVRFDIYVLDADLNELHVVAETPPVSDLTAPTASLGVLDVPFHASVTPAAGQWAEGDTIHLGISARDNGRLRRVVYQIGAPANLRDSIAVSDSAVTNLAVKVPVQRGWTGTLDVSVVARDAAGLSSEVVASGPGALRIYPLATHATWAGSFDGDVSDVALDARRHLLAIAQGSEHRVALVSWQPLAVTALVALPSKPSGLDLTPGGDSLVVALGEARQLAIVDLTRADYPVTVIPLAVDSSLRGGQPLGVRVAANGKAIVPLGSGQLWAQSPVLEYDLATGQQRVRADALKFGYESIVRSADRSAIALGGFVYPLGGSAGTGCAFLYRPASDTFSGCLGGRALSAASADGSVWVVEQALFDANLAFVRSLVLNNLPYFVSTVSPDGRLAYLGGVGTLTVERVSDGVALERFPLAVTARLLVTPDGATLFGIDNPYSESGAGRAVKIVGVSLPTF